uniref:Uncharacterized protein n=1 Tax=viral metagenome TaxID=1070528 RepID=A0A6M3KHC5_9ZZZZ
MRGYIRAVFQDKMGLQWEIEFCDIEDPAEDEKVRVRIHKLRDRILGSNDPERNGEGPKPESDCKRSGGHPCM